jgi:hypothetical protein
VRVAGGTDGNERLTAGTGALLVALLVIEGVTVLSLQSLLSLHVFVGVVLIPPVLLKLASTGYRFARYYTGNAAYVGKGAPPAALRALGPVVVLSAVALLVTGVALIVIGPGNSPVRGLHKLSFIVFAAAISLHVLGHLRHLPSLVAADWRRRARLAGAAGRRAVLVGSLAAGLALGGVAISYDGAWVHRHHHHHRFEDAALAR